ncbi:hypothetical protein KBA73_04755 [Patescibacteria group bacterium]|nr:hypothetical protein [Patescibacteria group bacterium]
MDDTPKIPDIDPDAPTPPSTEQLLKFCDGILPDHQRAASARGLDGLAFVRVGLVKDPEHPPECNSPPMQAESGMLICSRWKYGEHIPAKGDGGDWMVQSNVFIMLWGNKLFANVVTLVRPRKYVEGSALPVIPLGFAVEPMGLREAELNLELIPFVFQRGAVQYLVGLFADWGDWSPLPMSEYLQGLRGLGEYATATSALQHLADEGYVLIEELGEQTLIHAHPHFLSLFHLPP